MLRWFRLQASRVAAIAIAAMVAAGASAIRPHQDDCHDGPCAIVQHDASAHRIGGAEATDPAPIHCLVCHWAQSFRPRPEPRVTYVPVVASTSWIAIEFLTASVSTPLAQPPLRSPPGQVLL